MNQASVRQRLQEALSFHERGKGGEAAAIYRQIIASDPQNAEALHLLGVVELQTGNPGLAVTLIGRAIAIEPRNANYHSNLGLALSHGKHFEEALASFDRALTINPYSGNTLNHRGNVLRNLGRFDQALAAYARALAINPRHADALNNRGAAQADLNRTDEALASFDRALAADPNHAGALSNRGAVYMRSDRFHEALADLTRAISLDPNNAVVLNNRGNALCGLRRYDDAVEDFGRALAKNPRYTDAWYNRGTTYGELRRFEAAVADFDHALALDPGRVDVLIQRGQALQKLNRPGEALQCYGLVLKIDPNHATALVNRGHLLSGLGKFNQALADYDRAMAIEPDQELLPGWRAFCKLKLCYWREIADDIVRIEQGVRQGNPVCSPAVMLALSGSAEVSLQCAENYARRYFPSCETAPFPRLPRCERIRLGYFSADFHEHATAHLAAGVFEHHDRARFEITAFSLGPARQDEMRSRIESTVHRFVDISGISDAEAVQLARRTGIDIAIDMKGFTEGSRTGIFAMRAAPVQVNYLGYPGTLGAGYIDYLLADRIVLPDPAQKFYVEKIVRLPNSYQPNDSLRAISTAAVDRSRAGLPEGGFVFCCFNNSYKITPDIFDIWMRLLSRIERSVLWLFEDNPSAVKNLRTEAQMRGVNPERLIFAIRVTQAEHLGRHRLADLFLDTLPYNAHTTASDALWAGLPVLTRMGGGFQGRVAASLLCATGLRELITENAGDYEASALRLAGDPQELRSLREKLLANRDRLPLFDTARYTVDLEAAFTRMREQYLSGYSPIDFDV